MRTDGAIKKKYLIDKEWWLNWCKLSGFNDTI